MPQQIYVWSCFPTLIAQLSDTDVIGKVKYTNLHELIMAVGVSWNKSEPGAYRVVKKFNIATFLLTLWYSLSTDSMSLTLELCIFIELVLCVWLFKI